MKTIIKSVLLVATFAFAQNVCADEMLCLVVDEGGVTSLFALSEKPEITFNSSTMEVTSTTQTSAILFAVSADLNYYFSEEDATGINQVLATENTEFSDGKVLISGLATSAIVSVYTIDGKQVNLTRASEYGNVCLNLNTLPSGKVYIIKTPTTSYKIINK